MNLTVAIKKQAINDVVRDQFSEEIEAEFKKLQSLLTAAAVKQDDGITQKILDLYDTVASKIPNERVADTLRYYTAAKYNPSKNAELNSRYYHKLNSCRVLTCWPSERCRDTIFEMLLVADCPPTIIPPIFNLNNAPIHAQYKKLNALRTEAQMLTYDLTSLIFPVKNLKSLQSLTNIFDPFIKKPASTNTLPIPVQSLSRINKLKSPKNSKAAA